MNSRLFYQICLITVGLFASRTGPLQAVAVRTVAGTTASTLPANDDGSTAAVNIGFSVNFFGVTKSTLFVNNNGNLTFQTPLSAFTPLGISSTVDQPMIAAFFGDVDTRGTGSGLVKYGTGTLCGRKVFGANWIKVGYFSSSVDKLNSFQILLIDRSDTGPGNFDIEMNYDQIQWETGDASGGSGGLGGTSAEAGYTNGLTGSARVSYEFPGSKVKGAFLDSGANSLAKGSVAAGTAGRYHFFVRNGVVVGGSSGKELDISSSSKVLLPPRYVYSSSTNLFSGKVTIARIGAGSGSGSATDTCLDEKGTSTTPTKTPTPITLIFLKLPPNVTCANTALVTKKGFAYMTFPNGTLEPGQLIPFTISLRNPSRVNLPTYYNSPSFAFQIIAGKFDPAQY